MRDEPHEDDRRRAARMILERWRVDCESGQGCGFAELCARHPGHAAALHELRREHDGRTTASAVQQATQPTASFGPSAQPVDSAEMERLRRLGPAASRYRIVAEIGAGGMGTVYEAQDTLLQRTVAYKVIRDASKARVWQPRFLREMRIAAQLAHRGVAAIHDAGVDAAGRAFFTMPLLRGRDLSDHMHDARASSRQATVERVATLIASAVETMAYCHARGVVHCDLKPANIRIDEAGGVFLMDWGLAVEHAAGGARRSPGAAGTEDSLRGGGTPAYMAPERWMDPASEAPCIDVYAFGVMLYELLSGRLPHVGAGERRIDRHKLRERVLAGPPESIHGLAPRAPAELLAICARSIERDPARRYADCGEMLRDFRAYLEGREARAIRDFLLEDVFAAGDVGRYDRDTTISKVLVQATERTRERFADEPRLRAKVLWSAGRAMTGCGLPDNAVVALEQALESADSLSDEERIGLQTSLAEAMFMRGVGSDVARAAEIAGETVTRAAAAGYISNLSRAAALEALAGALKRLNRLDEAERAYSEELAILEADPSGPRKSILRVKGNILLVRVPAVAALAADAAHREQAVEGYLQLAEDFRLAHHESVEALGADDEHTLSMGNEWGAMLVRAESLLRVIGGAGAIRRSNAVAEQAVDVYAALLPRINRKLEPTHFRAVLVHGNYARALEHLGRLGESSALLQELFAPATPVRTAAMTQIHAVLAGRLCDLLDQQGEHGAALRAMALAESWASGGALAGVLRRDLARECEALSARRQAAGLDAPASSWAARAAELNSSSPPAGR